MNVLLSVQREFVTSNSRGEEVRIVLKIVPLYGIIYIFSIISITVKAVKNILAQKYFTFLKNSKKHLNSVVSLIKNYNNPELLKSFFRKICQIDFLYI